MRRNLSDIHSLQKQICLHSSQAAFTALFRLFYQSLYHFSLQYVHTHEAAEEIVNDVFIKIWSRRSTLQQIQNLESYLFIAVKNGSLNYIKQYSHYHIASYDEGAAGKLVSLYNPEEDMEWKELHFKLQQAINDLPDQCRKIFRLIKEEGFRMKQVAEILNISPRTVETQLYRAVKRLDKVLSGHISKKEGRRNNLISVIALVAASFSAWLQ